MNILYISPLISKYRLSAISQFTDRDPGYAVQKFNRLICQGFVANGHNTKALSALPMSRAISKKMLWVLPKDVENNVSYSYIPFINVSILRNVCLFLYSFFYVLAWGLFNKKQKFIACDVLAISICIGALLASKVLNLRIVGIMTDMPGLMVTSRKLSTKRRIITVINKSYLSSFSHYVFLTPQMEEVINTKHRPYIIMEGLVEPVGLDVNKVVAKNKNRVIMYAGGLYEKYGLKTLIEAFHQIDNDNISLYLYGTGSFINTLKDYCNIDLRIQYKGLVPNDEVVEMEKKATLLVNPRPSNEEFTKYSFPSKTVEYMASATPVLTTKLPGMPKEYYDYVYLIEEESVAGYKKALSDALNNSDEVLIKKGKEAQRFILENKNYKYQTFRIVELVKQ